MQAATLGTHHGWKAGWDNKADKEDERENNGVDDAGNTSKGREMTQDDDLHDNL